jgi:hypothetical protein
VFQQSCNIADFLICVLLVLLIDWKQDLSMSEMEIGIIDL